MRSLVFDGRFADLYNSFLAERGFEESKVDVVKGAGGAQALAGGEGADRSRCGIADRQVHQIAPHRQGCFHGHMDCGGYGGSAAFDNDHQKEWEHHVAELEKAAGFVRIKFPEIKEVECWLADFDGATR